MKARNLASPHVTLRREAPASEAAEVLARHDVRAVLVVDEGGGFVGVISDSCSGHCSPSVWTRARRSLG